MLTKDKLVNELRVFGDRANWGYSKKNLREDERAASLKVVPIKRKNIFDFSGDDSSLDPRFW